MLMKCNFCEACKPDGSCRYERLHGSRELECRKAIDRMVKAFGKGDDGKQKAKRKHWWD